MRLGRLASDPVFMRFHRFRYKGAGASPQPETGNQIGRNSLTLFECSLGIRYVLMAHQEHKKSADPHQAAESSVEISRSRDRSPAHRPLRVKGPCRLHRQVAGFGFRITPHA